MTLHDSRPSPTVWTKFNLRGWQCSQDGLEKRPPYVLGHTSSSLLRKNSIYLVSSDCSSIFDPYPNQVFKGLWIQACACKTRVILRYMLWCCCCFFLPFSFVYFLIVLIFFSFLRWRGSVHFQKPPPSSKYVLRLHGCDSWMLTRPLIVMQCYVCIQISWVHIVTACMHCVYEMHVISAGGRH